MSDNRIYRIKFSAPIEVTIQNYGSSLVYIGFRICRLNFAVRSDLIYPSCNHLYDNRLLWRVFMFSQWLRGHQKTIGKNKQEPRFTECFHNYEGAHISYKTYIFLHFRGHPIFLFILPRKWKFHILKKKFLYICSYIFSSHRWAACEYQGDLERQKYKSSEDNLNVW